MRIKIFNFSLLVFSLSSLLTAQQLSLNNKFILFIAENQLDSAKIYLDKGAEINEFADSSSEILFRANFTPLLAAKNLKVVKFLKENGADLNQANKWGDNILHIAVILNDTALVRYLLNNNLDIDKNGSYGRAPIHEAVRCVNIEVLELLLKSGCKVNNLTDNQCTALHIFTQGLGHPKMDIKKQLKMAQLLIEYGIDINFRDIYGDTALTWAYIECKKDNELTKYLISKGALK
ncbi:MAG TPA: ankyrin repeat domain-containing protein [Ignavibacteriaceae bacterium]|nr:ankyrin repeat domain-containing protein [Ignavibacteriaceae bacterium]